MAKTKGAPRMTQARKQALAEYSKARNAARNRLYRLRAKGYYKATSENILPPSINIKTATTTEIRKAVKELMNWNTERMREKAKELEGKGDRPDSDYIIAVERLLEITGTIAAQHSPWTAAGAHTATAWILAMKERYGDIAFGKMLLESGANEELSRTEILYGSDDLEVRQEIENFYRKIHMPKKIRIQLAGIAEEYAEDLFDYEVYKRVHYGG